MEKQSKWQFSKTATASQSICYTSTTYFMFLVLIHTTINTLNLRLNILLLFRINSHHIEDIYFFEENTKFILSSMLKTSEFSQVHSTSENFDVFNSQDDIYWVFTEKR